MDPQRIPIEIYRQLLESDFKTELAVASLLKQYKNYLLAAHSKRIMMSASIHRIILCFSSILKFHFEKIRFYYMVSHKKLHQCISRQLLQEFEMMQHQVEVTLESMRGLLPLHAPFHSSSVPMYFDDLIQSLSNIKKFFISVSKLPGVPWISPFIKQGIKHNQK